MKIKTLIITILIAGSLLLFLPKNANAETYPCNPYTCGCRTVTNASKCGSTNICVSGGGSPCCSGYYEYYDWGSLFVCTGRQIAVPNTCTIGCTTCYDTCCRELNTSPSQPINESITSDEGIYSLSLDANSPTMVDLSNATVSLPEITQPVTSKGVGYQFRFYDSSGTLLDTIESTSRTQSIPAEIITTMNSGGTFKISGLYYTVNECDSNKIYSTPLEGYITTNNRPELVNAGGSFDLSDIFSGLGADSSLGCSNMEYTGIEMNNPLNANITLTDEDGINEIEGVILWFRDTSSSTIQNFGVKIQKTTDWNNTETFSTNGTAWATISNKLIQNNDSENIARLYSVTTTSDTTVNIQFGLELLEATTPLQGEYEVYIQGLDTPTIGNENLSINNMTYIADLGIDLVKPQMEDEIPTDLTDIENILFSWNVTDDESGILSSRINGYVTTEDPNITPSAILLNGTTISNVEPPEGENQEEIGLMNDPYGLSISPPTNEVTLNIGENEFGNISIYIRVFDQACNSEIRSDSVSLAPWMASKGGYFYSQNAVRKDAKDLSALTELNNELVNFQVGNITQGTEILLSRSIYIYQLIHSELNAVSAVSVAETNNQENYWFNKILAIANAENNLNSPNQECTEDLCYYSTDSDIAFDTDFECTGNTLFISQGNITISPKQAEAGDIQTNNNTACIYVAKNNIIITNTGHEPNSKELSYDFLEGFFVAENQIILNNGTTDEDKKYGLEIEGSLIAFGTEEARSIQNNRSLKALNLISPSLLVNYHPKYSKISEELIGTISSTYLKEVGLSKK